MDCLRPQLLKQASALANNAQEAEEIVSDGFYKLWKFRETFHSVSNMSRYLRTVVKNSGINASKFHRRQKGLKDMLHYLMDKKEETAINGMSTEEILHMVYEEIMLLPPKPQQVIMLLLDGVSYRQIATIMHMLPATVRTNKARGIEQLRKRLRERGVL